jgi:hypothetical protein
MDSAAQGQDGAAHFTSPAATVWFVVSSIRISDPVVRTVS